MEVIFIILPLAIGLAALAVYAFARAVRGGQYDDLDTPALRILTEDEGVAPPPAPPAPASPADATHGPAAATN